MSAPSPVPAVTRSLPSIRPLPASLALVSMAVGLVVLTAIGTFVLLPLLVVVAFGAAWLVGSLLLGWAGIEALAAFERWLEQDRRFQR